MLPLLVNCVKKVAGHSNSIPVLTEALTASCLLAKLSTADVQAGALCKIYFGSWFLIGHDMWHLP